MIFTLSTKNVILIVDFNSEMSEDARNTFCITYNLECLICESTCFKNIDNPICIDLILTNKAFCFQNTDFYFVMIYLKNLVKWVFLTYLVKSSKVYSWIF